MHQSPKNLYHLLFGLLLVTLFCYKWEDLHLPYYWDELGVYARAADYQSVHGISLMPASLPPELSRGHPLLFTAMAATAMRLTGGSLFGVHLFCFGISILLLLVVYQRICKYFNARAALFSVFIIAVQPVFLAQCGFALPEVSLALFLFLALCSYGEGKYLYYALFASLAIMTKESALVAGPAVLLYSFYLLLKTQKRPTGFQWFALFCTAVPYLVYVLFLMIQKRDNGWFFFPYHMELVSFNLHSYYHEFRRYASFVFLDQGRLALLCFILAALPLGWHRIFGAAKHFSLLLFWATALLIGLNAAFSVYLDRYVLAGLIFFAVFAGLSVATLPGSKWLSPLLALLLLYLSAGHQKELEFHYDADLGFRDGIEVVEKSVVYTTKLMKPGDKISGNFPAWFALSFARAGYQVGHPVNASQLDNRGDYYMLFCEPGNEWQLDTAKYSFQQLQAFRQGSQGVKVIKVTRKNASAQ